MRKYLISLSVLMMLVFVAVLYTGCNENNIETEERVSDMIMWYDIGYASRSIESNDAVWHSLYSNYPEITVDEEIHRSATPLLGLYDQTDDTTARQHLYWISALGCNGLTCDWTNFYPNDYPSVFEKKVYTATEVLLKTAKEITEFEAPKIYITVRMHGDEFDTLRKTLDSVWSLYQKYPDQLYYYKDDISGDNKPLVVIFADGSKYLYGEWMNEKIPFEDERFTIRWSNGLISAAAKENNKGEYVISSDNPYWLFWESKTGYNEQTGLYPAIYRQGVDGKPEQMAVWASVFSGDGWDELNNKINGMTTFERSLSAARKVKPKTLLVCRFNYPIAWGGYPAEGQSLKSSTHIEPCEDLGFTVFDNVKKNLYDYNNFKAVAPDKPVVIEQRDGIAVIDLAGYPTEYRISDSSVFKDSEWKYLNVSDWINISDFAVGSNVYLQTRNTFGESKVVCFISDGTSKSVIENNLQINFENVLQENRGMAKLFTEGGYSSNEYVLFMQNNALVAYAGDIDLSQYSSVTIAYSSGYTTKFDNASVIFSDKKANINKLKSDEIIFTVPIKEQEDYGKLIIYGDDRPATKESGWAEIERIVTIPIDSDYSGPVYLSVNGCNSLVIIATIIFK